MNAGDFPSSPLRLVVRWAARVTGLLLFGLVVAIAIGEGGPPNVLGQPGPVRVEFAALGLMLLGLAVGWLREGLGGLLVLFGLGAFNAVELAVNGRPALGAFPLFAVPGVFFLLSALAGPSDRQQPAGP